MTQTQDAYKKIVSAYTEANRERDAIMADLLRFIAKLPANGRVLDIGCGPGFDTAVLRQHNFRAIGVDLSWEMLHSGQSPYPAPRVQANMLQLPFAKVDGVWACASLLHLPRTAMPAALQEIARILHPGGLFYLSLKWGEGESWSKTSYGYAAPRFFTYWTPETLDPLLTAAGFTFPRHPIPNPHPPWLVRFAYRQPITSKQQPVTS